MDAPAPSRFFLVPPELRLLIYEFLFTSFPSPVGQQSTLQLPYSSDTLVPLLVSRQFYLEARCMAFACTTHNINWTWTSNCVRRVQHLEPSLYHNIRHVAFATSATGLYEKLLPLRPHLDHSWVVAPHLALESLTIVLDYPDSVFYEEDCREKRIKELDIVFASVWYLKNIEKVVLLNIAYRDGVKEWAATQGKWTSMDEMNTLLRSEVVPSGKGSTDDMRWRYEMTEFYDYEWKPWHGLC